MKTNLILCLILIASLYACTEKTSKEVYTSFERTDTLAANVHTIPPIMLNPKGIFLTGPYLVALNDKMDTCFQVFDKTTLQYLYSFGLKGQGSNDFQMPSGQFAGHHSGTTLVTDVNRVKAISFVDGKPQITPVLLPIQRSYYNGLISMADSTYVCESEFEDSKEYLFIYPDGTVQQKIDYPETEERFGDISKRNQAYGRIAAARPSGDRFASFYSFERHFRIIGKEGNILHDVRLDILPREEQIPVEDKDRRIHTLSVYATENHIYTLNLDMKPEEIYKQERRPSIQVFTWDGEPVAQLFLDRFISSFTVDEDEQVIYGVFAENESEIYTFHINRE